MADLLDKARPGKREHTEKCPIVASSRAVLLKKGENGMPWYEGKTAATLWLLVCRLWYTPATWIPECEG